MSEAHDAQRDLLRLKLRESPILVNAKGARRVKKINAAGEVTGEADTADLLVGLLHAEALKAEVVDENAAKERACMGCGKPFSLTGLHPNTRRCESCRKPVCFGCGAAVHPHSTTPRAIRARHGQPPRCLTCHGKVIAERRDPQALAEARARSPKVRAAARANAARARASRVPGKGTLCLCGADKSKNSRQCNACWKVARCG